MKKLGGVLLAMVTLVSCWDFNKLYEGACKTGNCSAGGGGAAGGSPAGGGTAESDGGAGGGSAGGGAGGGGAVTACKSWGEKCGGPNECCATDTLVPGAALGCSNTGYCEETGEACKPTGFWCADAKDCCDDSCIGGRCAACLDEYDTKDKDAGVSCTSAKQCCKGYSCFEGQCKEGPQPDGARCQNSAGCAGGFCDFSKGTPSNGVCVSSAASNCIGFAQDAGVAQCCADMKPTYGKEGPAEAAGTCRMVNQSRCDYGYVCASTECWGGRCLEGQPGLREPCLYASNCKGRNTVCSYPASHCADRICLSKRAGNGFEGCCTISINADVCDFSPGVSCLMGGTPSGDKAQCCSGILRDDKTCDYIRFSL
jgi:hypothetical protein